MRNCQLTQSKHCVLLQAYNESFKLKTMFIQEKRGRKIIEDNHQHLDYMMRIEELEKKVEFLMDQLNVDKFGDTIVHVTNKDVYESLVIKQL